MNPDQLIVTCLGRTDSVGENGVEYLPWQSMLKNKGRGGGRGGGQVHCKSRWW